MKKKGFTLLELIIVIIIMGVLASLALPRMFFMVRKSRAAEAIQMFEIYHKRMSECLMAQGHDITTMTAVSGGTGAINNCYTFINSLNLFPYSRFSDRGFSRGGTSNYSTYSLTFGYEGGFVNTMRFTFKNISTGGGSGLVCGETLDLNGQEGVYYVGCGDFGGIKKLP